MNVYNYLENDFKCILEEIEVDLKDEILKKFDIFNEELNISKYWHLETDFNLYTPEKKIEVFMLTIL